MRTKAFFAKLSLVLAAAIFAAIPALAADFVLPVPGNSNVIVGSQESHKNLYIAGGNVSVNGKTSGDLVAAGGMVTVSGNVEQELLLAGGNLNLTGSVGGNARVAGGNISISSPVGGDLVVAGGNITVTGQASIGGDLVVAGGSVVVDGPVSGNVRIVGGTVSLNSKVSGNVYVKAKNSLSFGPSAEVLGKVDYTGPKEANISAGANIGTVNFTKANAVYKNRFAVIATLGFLIKLLAWLIAAFVVLKFRKNFVKSLADNFQQKPWENLGWGLLVFIGGPVLIVLLFVTFVGYYLAILAGLIYALLLVAGALVSAMVMGYILLKRFKKPGEPASDWQAILLGVVVWMVLAFIPVLGWLVMAVVFLMVLGAGVKKLKQDQQI